MGGGVNRLIDARHEDVRLPARVLVPPELFEAAGHRDDVGLAIPIQVRDYDLIAASEVGADRVGDESAGDRVALCDRQGRT